MRYEMSENAMEKLVQDVADIKAGQAFYKESLQRIENKLDATVDDHAKKLRELEIYKDRQLGLLGLAAVLGSVLTWSFDHISKLLKP